ncbi:MAG: WbqC family protein [Crocinitomicaceae bacterium]|nr:WbqC family protein [Crocinitomicaceae bacterium]MBP6032533.1 WbqC family protein [Crocinitomicaceae bacterium]
MTVFPTAYFPSIDYLHAFVQAKDGVIEFHEHFQKQTIRTRCEILTANGILRLSIPTLHESGRKIPVQELKIDHSGTWKNDHWRAITSAYALAPYFEDYAKEIEEIIFANDVFLWEKNERCLRLMETVLDQHLSIQYTDSFQGVTGDSSKNAYLSHADWNKANYQQVFSYDKEFCANLSMIDLLFNEGPFCRKWILASED